ncbi:ent-copalyl diphosphate synthase, chloroplastic [Rhodamnia argentea]|uniref:Ent-copalyl diphosphate synthase, chloroplastic n=1 Tax=Rhodamnia argentea TaxID=178133 RepID=A0ABM3GX85_9MYRT|nr:ent-copalyl diphosphate synthase, chloroplastic [Rhodamnia argentea]
MKWQEIVEDGMGVGDVKVGYLSSEIEERVEAIKSMFLSMSDGEISTSAYDTAWVALVEDVDRSGNPQFPEALQWIADNQHPDGSWGDDLLFFPHDRILNTLACVVALKYWKIHPDKCEKGISFFKDNISKLGEEKLDHMPIGFEVTFPSLVETARKLEIKVCDDSPVFEEIYAIRNTKLNKIPSDVLHQVPTSLLHSLEGMKGLNWEKLLKLKNADGSFLFSPSATAFAFLQTGDVSCLNYLRRTVQRFHGGVPNVYPVDLFEHLWAVDRLQRLGVSRYFKEEIKECMGYVYRYWSDKGICWARNSRITDIDDTAMGFRLLRLHGHGVSADVFEQFKRGNEFSSFEGQSTEAVTGMFNLYRASQLIFPGEKILEDANRHAAEFLRRKQEANELVDKWIITKDLPGEVGYALDVPWYASLPRVEMRFYIDQYGGESDIWIGKTLYRMGYVNNNVYLELAKLDYNNCQALHLSEWDNFQRWYCESKLVDFGTSWKTLLYSYFTAAASIYEPERARERLAWAKTSVLVDTIASCLEGGGTSHERRRAFVHEFRKFSKKQEHINGRSSIPDTGGEGLVATLLGTLDQLSLQALVARGIDVSHPMRAVWEKWLLGYGEEGDKFKGVVELLVQMIALGAGGNTALSDDLSSHPRYHHLCNLADAICRRLARHQTQEVCKNERVQTETAMQELVQLVLQDSTPVINRELKDAFFAVTRSFYYTAHCDAGTIDSHIAKVLFERVN